MSTTFKEMKGLKLRKPRSGNSYVSHLTPGTETIATITIDSKSFVFSLLESYKIQG